MEALDSIGAKETKKLLKKAIQLAFNGQSVPANREQRQKLLNRPTAEAEKQLFTDLDELDQEFYRYKDPIGNLVNNWLSENK